MFELKIKFMMNLLAIIVCMLDLLVTSKLL